MELVKTFTKHCLLKPKVFKNVEEICNARVPIVKFYHIPSKLICDVSFKSGLSVYNTKLIKYVTPQLHIWQEVSKIAKCLYIFLFNFSHRLYLSMSTTVKWLVCVIVKHWALQNDLKDRHLFTSYALIWLVLFYLMTEKVVPSVMELRQKASKDDHKIIEGTYIVLYPFLIIPKHFIYFFFNQGGTVRLENGRAISVTINVLNFYWVFINSMPIRKS